MANLSMVNHLWVVDGQSTVDNRPMFGDGVVMKIGDIIGISMKMRDKTKCRGAADIFGNERTIAC